MKNIGSGNTGNLIATLLQTNGVTSPGDPQSYGVVSAGGGVASEPFTFTAGGTCGGSIMATLQLQDGPVDLGTITYTLLLGQLTPLAEDFDGVTAPNLPAGWSTATLSGQSNWVTSTVQASSPANAAFSPDFGVIGVNELDSPVISVTTTSAVLTFRQFYSLAADPTNSAVGLDGGVLEIKIGGGSYADIVTAGGSFVSGGYNSTLISTNGNPLGGRAAWSGSSTNFITTTVNLPAAAAGQNVQLRWRGGAGTVPNSITASGTLAFWNFDASTPNVNTVATNVTAAPVTVSNISGSLTYFAGNGSPEAIAGNGFTMTAGLPTSSYSYFAFALTVANGSQLNLSSCRFDDRASGTGPQTFDVQISQQSNFSTIIYDSGANATHPSFTATPMNTLTLTNAGLTGTVYFRIYGYAAGAAAGTWRLDNLNVQGSVASAGGIGSGWYIDSVSVRELACCTGSVTPPPDAFQTWQNQYFGCTDCAQAQADADPFGKGMSNTNQFLAGLDPTNPASLFRIISVAPQGNDLMITWTSAGAHTNTLQATASGGTNGYGTNFTDISGPIILQGSGGMTTDYVDVGGSTNVPARFYRVRLVP